jgi:ankyrin repeat protein
MLLAAVAGSNYPLVQQIISICPTAEQSDFLHDAYFEAVKHPSLEMVEKLIDSGIEISLYHYGQTALGMAAARGELAVVKLLLACGLDRSHLSYNDSLIQATMEGHEHVVAFLLDEGIDINSRKKRLFGNRHMEGDRCVTALFSAALRNEDYMFQFLLDRGAKLDPKDGKEALGVACNRRDKRLRQFLLDAGLDGSRCDLTETEWVHDCLAP